MVYRLSIPVSDRVHAAFLRISESSGVSLGRCMSQWLDDTIDAAEYMSQKMEDARTAPRIVARELHSYAAGLSVASDAVISRARRSSSDPLPPV